MCSANHQCRSVDRGHARAFVDRDEWHSSSGARSRAGLLGHYLSDGVAAVIKLTSGLDWSNSHNGYFGPVQTGLVLFSCSGPVCSSGPGGN
jgi:hypothetical protein